MAKRYLTTEQRRSALRLAYCDRAWTDKVDKMPRLQVYAIFDSFVKTGRIKFDEYGNLHFDNSSKKKEPEKYHQITFDEYLKDIEQKRNERKEELKNEVQ